MTDIASSAATDGTKGAAGHGAGGVMKAAVYHSYGPPDVLTMVTMAGS